MLAESAAFAQKAVELWIKAGERLIQEKEVEVDEHGAWLPFLAAVGIDEDKAQRLMRIARHPGLTNPAHRAAFPVAWSTLAVLSRIDADRLKQLIKDGKVHPEMDRTEAEALVKPTYVTVMTTSEPRKITEVVYTGGDLTAEEAAELRARQGAALRQGGPPTAGPAPAEEPKSIDALVAEGMQKIRDKQQSAAATPPRIDQDDGYSNILDAWNRAGPVARARFKRYLRERELRSAPASLRTPKCEKCP
jgi:hypothetical protein